MLGKRSDQRGLFESDQLFVELVKTDSFYGKLAALQGQLFRDEEFADFYCEDNGRSSKPPSLMATALVLQAHDKVSDAEASARAAFDLRWKVALGVDAYTRPFAQSTLQCFRAQLILHEKMRAVFVRSLSLARKRGLLKGKALKAVLDTTPILGRGAAKDTFNLLADGIRQLLRQLASAQEREVAIWAGEEGYARYLEPSIKGESRIDWDDEKARMAFLQGIVADADRLLEQAREAQAVCAPDSPERGQIADAARLLGQLLLQDVERPDEGVRLKKGVSKDRIMSVHDPARRHGRKRRSQRFDGHKASVAVDPESQLVTAVAVLPGNAPDARGALALVEASEENTGLPVTEVIADAAYGDGRTRQAFVDSERTLRANVPKRAHRSRFPKEDFVIDLATLSCTCPADQVTHTVRRRGRDAYGAPRRYFRCAAAVCDACPLRPQCVAAQQGRGRTVTLHPQERLLQAARVFQHREAAGPYRRLRQTVEHRIARLVQLGLRQARFFGHQKTSFQLYMTATVANLTRILAPA